MHQDRAAQEASGHHVDRRRGDRGASAAPAATPNLLTQTLLSESAWGRARSDRDRRHATRWFMHALGFGSAGGGDAMEKGGAEGRRGFAGRRSGGRRSG